MPALNLLIPNLFNFHRIVRTCRPIGRHVGRHIYRLASASISLSMAALLALSVALSAFSPNAAAQDAQPEPGEDFSVVQGEEFTLDASGSINAAHYFWQLSQPEGANNPCHIGGITQAQARMVMLTLTAPANCVGDIIFSLGVDKPGTAPLLFAGDGSGIATITITVTAPPTTADAGDDFTVVQGGIIDLDGSGSSMDVERYAWVITSPTDTSDACYPALGLGDSIIPKPLAVLAPSGCEGDIVFTLHVSDTASLALLPQDLVTSDDSDTVTVTVVTADTTFADAGDDQTVAAGNDFTLDGSGSMNVGRYSWARLSPLVASGSPCAISIPLGKQTEEMPTFTAPIDCEGEIVFGLQVDDATTGLFSSDDEDRVTVTVTAAAPVVAEAGPDQDVTGGDIVTLSASGSENANSWGWFQSSPHPLTSPNSPCFSVLAGIDSSSEEYVIRVPFACTGDIVFTLSVVREAGRKGLTTDAADDTDTVTVKVTANTAAISADAGEDRTVMPGGTFTLDLSGSMNFGIHNWEQIAPIPTGCNINNQITVGPEGGAIPRMPTVTVPETCVGDIIVNLYVSTRLAGALVTSADADATDTVTISVEGETVSPMAGDDQTVLQGDVVTLDGIATNDALRPGWSLLYQWTQASPVAGNGVVVFDTQSAPLFETTRTFTTPSGYLGELVFELLVGRNEGGFLASPDADPVTITVVDVIAEAGPNRVENGGDAVTLDGSMSMVADGVTATYSWQQTAPTSGAGSGVTLGDADTAMPVFVMPSDLTGDTVLEFELTLTGNGDSSTDTVTVGFNPVVANAGTNVDADEGDTITLNAGLSSHANDLGLSYAWGQIAPLSGKGSRLPLTNANTATPSFTAPVELLDDVEAVFEVVVSSGDSNNRDTVTVNIAAGVNDPPTAVVSEDRSALSGDVITLDGDGSSDPEDETLTYLWTQTAPTSGDGSGIVLSDADAEAASFTVPDNLATGVELVFELTVTAGEASDKATVSILIGGTTTAVVSDDIMVGEGESVTVSGDESTNSNPAATAFQYQWTQTAPTAGRGGIGKLDLSGADTATLTFTTPQNLPADLDLIFELQVTADGDADTATVTVTVDAGENQAPTADAGRDRNVRVGSLVVLDGSGSSDPEDEPLIYQWEQILGEGLGAEVTLANDNRRRASFTFPTAAEGQNDIDLLPLVFSLVVTDTTQNESRPDLVTIAVLARETELNEILLPEIARAIAGSTSAVTSRIQQAGLALERGRFEFGGKVYDGNGNGSPMATAALALAQMHDSNGGLDVRKLLGNSSFVMPLHLPDGERADGRHAAVWGSGDHRSLKGENETFEWEGDFNAWHLGFDSMADGHWVRGIAFSTMESAIEFDSISETGLGEGMYEIAVNSANPYFSYSSSKGGVWGSVGFGLGELDITPEGGETLNNDFYLRNISVGGETVLRTGNDASFAFRAEAAKATIELDPSETTQEVNSRASRARLSFEVSNAHKSARGGVSEPTFELAARFDGGDGETGGGGELGVGIKYHSPEKQFIAEISGRSLLFHSGDYEEWGVQGGVRVQPGLDGQGISFNFRPGYGDTQSRMTQLWQDGLGNLVGDRKRHYAMRYDARLGYGMSLNRYDGIFTPYGEMTGGHADSYRMGVQWQHRGIGLDLVGERKSVENVVLLKGSVTF